MKSASRSNSSAPIRAITSSLSARSAQPIPLASQAYEPFAKAVLRHRLLYSIFPWSLCSTWVITVFWSIWFQDAMPILAAIFDALSPKTLVFALATWVSATLPAIVLRNRFLTMTPSTAPSPSKMFSNALSKRRTSHALLTYMLSSVSLGIIHLLMHYAYESPAGGNPRPSLFVKSKKHPYYLNGSVLYLFCSQMTLAAVYLLRDILLDRFAVCWVSASSAFYHRRRQDRVANTLVTIVTLTIFTAFCTAGYILLFGLARSIVLPLLYTLPIVPRILRPFTAHFLRGSWTLFLVLRHWSLIWQTFYLGLTTVIMWEFADSPYNEANSAAHLTADPALALVSGITSSDPYFKHLAYAELKELASENSPVASTQRSALFEDQKHHPHMWSCLVRDALLTLGRDYQLLLRRGKPEPSAPVPTAQPKPAPSFPVPTTPLIRKTILKGTPPPPFRAALDTLASDGPFSTVAASTEASASHIPALFRSVIHEQPSTQAAAVAVKEGEKKVHGILQLWEIQWKQMAGAITLHVTQWKKTIAALPFTPQVVVDVLRQVGDWWTRERVNKLAEISLPNRHLDALIVGVLCHLIRASLNEDMVGVVQQDMPRIIEALLSFLTALEDYQVELNALYIPPSREELGKLSANELAAKNRLAEEIAKAGDVLSTVSDELKDGVMIIAETFDEKLEAFKFPSRTARKLQGFVDYI